MELSYSINRASSPIIMAAIHDGHLIDETLSKYLILQEHERFREEDPYTAYLANLPVSQVIVQTSRFQVDLNRKRQQAIYRRPEDAWGLEVWRSVLPDELVQQLLAGYDAFYRDLFQLIEYTIERFGKFVVLDIHSYNYRRDAPDRSADAGKNPEINIGTGHNQDKWTTFGQHFTRFLAHNRIDGHYADVRENVKFSGGGFAEWINAHFGEHGCVFSVEFKKTFMDEWTGRVDIDHLRDMKSMLNVAIPYLLDALDIQDKMKDADDS